MEMADPRTDETVMDVYCGAGLFSAFLAGRSARLIGIEESPSAVKDFEINLDAFDSVELYAGSGRTGAGRNLRSGRRWRWSIRRAAE